MNRLTIVVAGIVVALSLSCALSSFATPFNEKAQVEVKTDDASTEPPVPSMSLNEIIARKNAIPNFPWNWKARDRVLLDGAKLIVSTADIIALTGESGFKNVRDQILLAGISTPKNFADVKALYERAYKKGTKDAILLANVDKLSLDEIDSAANMVSSDAKDRFFRKALSKAQRLNRQSGETIEATQWLTDPGRSCYLNEQPEKLRFGQVSVKGPTIELDEARTFQSMDGFGFALTGGSAHLINSLSTEARAALLKNIFSPDGPGIGASFIRLSIGASDLSVKSFSCDDVPSGQTDTDLRQFDISAGDLDVVPVVKEILAVNPSIRILATPWSAPPWMKTGKSFKGGRLKPEYYSCYATYFVKYLEAMREQGIRIQAISPQNEPLNASNEPSMLMDAGEQAAFIGKHLGPALKNAGLEDVEIFCWDHNCDRKDYPVSVLSDSGAREYIAGVAWHLYAGDIGALSEVRQSFPEKKMYLSEQWTGKDGTFAGDLRWHVKTVLIGSIRNWSQAVLEWNLASDPSCDPHTPAGCPDCKGALTITPGVTPKLPFNVSYYIIGHASKFIRPGSVRIYSNPVDQLPSVAFKTTDGKLALIALNDTNDPLLFNIRWQGKTAVAYLNRGAVGTWIWK